VDNVTDAKEQIQKANFDFALLDIFLPDGNGLELLGSGIFSPNTGIVVMTGDGNVQNAVEAMKLGAADYLTKPFDFNELPIVFERCNQVRQQARVREYELKTESGEESGFFFGEGLADIKAHLLKIIRSDETLGRELPPILIEGETGTGKSTLARWVHHHGPRAEHPLIELNCSTLPEHLAESELFGHERGAFTDAGKGRIGLFEASHKGTLFLDEISSLSLPIQAKVLTAIEDRHIRRIGTNKPIFVDVRVIAASLKNLKDLVREGVFREDLYHRLDLIRIHIPPLRKRQQDIMPLAEVLLGGLGKRYHRQQVRISKVGGTRLATYHWPGNVRELSHEIERSLILHDQGSFDFSTLSSSPAETGNSGSDPSEWLNPGWSFPEGGLSIEDVVNRFIHMALSEADQNVSAAARLLKVPRDYIRYRLKKKPP